MATSGRPARQKRKKVRFGVVVVAVAFRSVSLLLQSLSIVVFITSSVVDRSLAQERVVYQCKGRSMHLNYITKRKIHLGQVAHRLHILSSSGDISALPPSPCSPSVTVIATWTSSFSSFVSSSVSSHLPSHLLLLRRLRWQRDEKGNVSHLRIERVGK